MTRQHLQASEPEGLRFSVLIIGARKTGKTTLISNLTGSPMPTQQVDTFYYDHYYEPQQYVLNIDNRSVILSVNDTVHRERDRIAPRRFRGARAIVQLFDATDPNALSYYAGNICEIQRFAAENVRIYLLLTKSDIIPNQTTIDQLREKAGEDYPVFNINATNSEHLRAIFTDIARNLV